MSHIRTHTHTCMYTFKHTHIRTHTHTYMYTFKRTHIRTHTHTYMYTFKHTHIRTHTHTYMYLHVLRLKAGADVNAKLDGQQEGAEGFTALMWAAYGGHKVYMIYVYIRPVHLRCII